MLLQVNDLSYFPRNLKILNEVDLDLNPEEVLMVVGPNGAGKSTLLSLLANEMKAHHGKICFKGRNLREWEAQNLALHKAKFSQAHNGDIALEVQDIVMMGRYPYFSNHPNESDHQIVERCMKMMEVISFKNRNYNLLSGGEKQRVHLARVFAQLENKETEKLGFFDEPLNNLDVRHQYRILEQIRSFVKSGNSAVVVLHDLNLAAEFADRVILMRKGEVLAHGKPEEIFTSGLIAKAYDFPCSVMKNPLTKCPMILFRN